MAASRRPIVTTRVRPVMAPAVSLFVMAAAAIVAYKITQMVISLHPIALMRVYQKVLAVRQRVTRAAALRVFRIIRLVRTLHPIAITPV